LRQHRDDIPERELIRGKARDPPHAEHVKLLRSLKDGRNFDTPPEPVQRYQAEGTRANLWSGVLIAADGLSRQEPTHRSAGAGADPLVDGRLANEPQTIPHSTPTSAFIFDLPVATLLRGTTVVFTMFWPQHERWKGTNFSVEF
jgi:glucoamylase